MSVKLLTEHHLEFLSFKEGCTGSPESTLVKIAHCWKSHVEAYLLSELLTQVGHARAHFRSSPMRSGEAEKPLKVWRFAMTCYRLMHLRGKSWYMCIDFQS